MTVLSRKILGMTSIVAMASLFPPVTLNAESTMNTQSVHSSTFIDANAVFTPVRKLDVSYKIEGKLVPLASSNAPQPSSYYARVEVKAVSFSDGIVISCNVETSDTRTEDVNYAPNVSSSPCSGASGNAGNHLITANSTYQYHAPIKMKTDLPVQVVVLNFSYL